jgi:hypothetical protein
MTTTRKLNDFQLESFQPAEFKQRFVIKFPDTVELAVADCDDKLLYWAQRVTTRTVYMWNLIINGTHIRDLAFQISMLTVFPSLASHRKRNLSSVSAVCGWHGCRSRTGFVHYVHHCGRFSNPKAIHLAISTVHEKPCLLSSSRSHLFVPVTSRDLCRRVRLYSVFGLCPRT